MPDVLLPWRRRAGRVQSPGGHSWWVQLPQNPAGGAGQAQLLWVGVGAPLLTLLLASLAAALPLWVSGTSLGSQGPFTRDV